MARKSWTPRILYDEIELGSLSAGDVLVQTGPNGYVVIIDYVGHLGAQAREQWLPRFDDGIMLREVRFQDNLIASHYRKVERNSEEYAKYAHLIRQEQEE